MQQPFLIFILTIITHLVYAQIEVTLTVENQNINGTDFYFDIYLYRSSGSAGGDLYLKDADFYLNFNAGNFTNPNISKVGSSPGQCNFKPTNGNSTDELLTAINYYDNTNASLNGAEQIVIELNGPVPTNQQTFDTRVAKINNSKSTHCLGRFKITGINNPFGTAGLKWITSGSSLVTKVSTMENSTPFFGSEVNLNAIDPVDVALPIELVSFTIDILEDDRIKLHWKTANEIQNHGFEIEKRVQEEKWVKIGFVLANQSQSDNEYSFLDPNPSKGINFYRLKQLDIDGKFSYSNIISIYFSNTNGFEVFPNPVTNELFIEGINTGFYQITNSVGIPVMKGVLKEKSIGVSELPTGIYIIFIDNKNSKFLKW